MEQPFFINGVLNQLDLSNQISHTRAVAGFVVVPTYYFRSVSNNLGQFRIEDTAVGISNNVNAHNLVFGIFHDAFH